MKEKIKWDGYSWRMTIMVTVAYALALIITRDTPWRFYFLVILAVILFISLWIWAPVSIFVDTDFLTVHRRIVNKKIPLSEIQTVSLFEPQVDRGFKLCGSGGFAGYYGWYHDSRIGRYFGYYGNRQDCFHVLLKNGKQYVLGCENVAEMVKYIKSQLVNKE